MMSSFFQMQSPSSSGSLPSNTIVNPRGDLKVITTRRGVSYDRSTIPPTSSPLPKEVKCEPEATKDKVQTTNLRSTAHVQPPVVQVPIPEPDVAPKPNPKPSIPYPSRLNDQKLREKANNQMLKFLQIFQRFHFDLSFADALLHMPKFASTFKSLLSNKEKLFELANTPLNENCLAVLLKKLPKKIGDPGKFLIPCDFSKLVDCLALVNLGASINLMPLSVWKKLYVPELTHTRMTLELANRSVAYPVRVAEDVIVKVGKFHFPADFVVVDYDVDPRVPLILGRPFWRTARALVDVFGEELILRDGDEKLIFNVDNTSKHPRKHANESINMINFIDITCEDRRCFKQIVKPELQTIVETPVATMADTLGLLQLVTTSQFHGFERDDPHSHIRWFNKITSTLKYKNVPQEAIKLMLFTFSLEGAARIWLEKEPPRSIHTREDLVSKFVNYFFPPSKTTNLKNDIMNFQQRFDETFNEAWDRFKDLLPAGSNLLNRTPRDSLTIIENKSKVRTSRNKPVVSKVIDTTSSTPAYLPEITTLTDAVKAMLLQNKTPSPAPIKAIEEICVTFGGPHPYYECLATNGNTFNASTTTGTYNQGGIGYRPQGETNYRASNQMRPPGFPQPNVQNNQNWYNQNRGYNQNNFNQGNQNYQAPFNQTQVGPSNDFSNYMKTNDANMRAMQNQITNMKAEFKNEVQTTIRNQRNELKNDIKNMMSSFFQMQSPSGSGSLPSNTIANPRGDLKVITTRSGVSYDRPMIPPTSSHLPKEVEREPKATKDKVQTTNLGSTAHVQPPVVQVPITDPDVAPKLNPKPSIPYPSRLNDQKPREKANNQMLKFLQIFQRLHFDLSFADALLHMPKFASMFKSLLSNKEKLFELTNTPLNENCSAVFLKNLPKKLRDPGKFLIPCDFLKLVECLALTDLGASINLMPLSVWKKFSLSELTHSRMTLELANRSVAYPVGVAEDVIVKVGKFHFPANFVVVDYDVDPRVPIILGRPFLRTARALVDVLEKSLF
ncbi:reverse transcriptase domain-containing protein [Tanacetum coccineum]